MNNFKEKIILGIDPGTTIMGFGLIKVTGNKMEFIQMNELVLNKQAFIDMEIFFKKRSKQYYIP